MEDLRDEHHDAARLHESQAADPRFDRLRRIAKYQRWVLLALSANVLLNISFFMDLVPDDTSLDLVESLLAIVILLTSGFSIYSLAIEFYSKTVSALFVLGLFIPFAALLSLLVVNQRATEALQKNGYRVGLLGISPNRI